MKPFPKKTEIEPKETLEPKPKEKIFSTFGIIQRDGLWCVVELRTQGDRVVERLESELTMKFIAIDQFKVKAIKEFQKDWS